MVMSVLFSGFFPEATRAATLSKTEFKVGDNISLSGSGFGTAGYICFGDTSGCYDSSLSKYDAVISTWNDKNIKFIVPPWALPAGEIIVINDNKKIQLASVPYKLISEITAVSDTEGREIIRACAGDEIIIHGSGFGESGESVGFGDSYGTKSAEVLSWTYNKIRVIVPSTTKVSRIIVYTDGGTESFIPFELVTPLTNDEYYKYQTYLTKTGIESAWETLLPQEEIIVAVIDDGIYQNQPDLKNNFWKNEDEIAGNNKDDDNNGYVDDYLGYDFMSDTSEVTQNGPHGTYVAGIIGATRDNTTGIAGISQKVKLMPLIVCNKKGCSDSAIKEAIRYAVDNGARVINLSLSGVATDTYESSYDRVIKYAYNHNVAIVVAAGNGDINGQIGYDLDRIPQSPVCNDGDDNFVMGVGASNRQNTATMDWSNYGSCVDISAPGEGVTGLTIGSDEVELVDGTSFSAPIVAGLMAHILSAYPKMSNQALYRYIIENNTNGFLDAKKIAEKIKANYSIADDFAEDSVSTENAEDTAENQEALSASLEADTIFEKDISRSQYAEAIAELKYRNVISGYPDGTFKPFKTINRAEFTKIVIGATEPKLKGSNCFPDIADEWFAPYVCTAKNNYVIAGYPDGKFKPENEINVAEALKIVFNAFKIWVRPADSAEEWYAPYVEYARDNDLYLETFTSSAKNITREEMAELVYRLMK